MVKFILSILTFAVVLSACDRKDAAKVPGQKAPETASKENYLPPYAKPIQYIQAQNCLQIYYDQSKDSSYWMGQVYATMTSTLASHFPEIPQRIKPIDQYQAFEVYQCRYNIYIGSYFDNVIPESFLTDYLYAPTQIAWLGYNPWQMGLGFEKIFGYKYQEVSTLDKTRLDRFHRPTFYRNFTYKNQVFSKYGEYDKKTGEFLSSYDILLFKQTSYNSARILSWAQHNGTGEQAPYVFSTMNRYYVADIPFSFIHETDRYLIFTDLLFDILERSPKRSQHYAFVRVEEVDPNFLPLGIADASHFLKTLNIKPQIPIVPTLEKPEQSVASMKAMHEKISVDDPQYIWVGVKSVVKPDANFGFWDLKNDVPLIEDSVDFVLTRLEGGFQILKDAGITPQIWMTPFNAASALDSSIFARVFPWRLGRTVNYNFTQQNMPAVDGALYFRDGSAHENMIRRNAFQDTKVSVNLKSWSGQFFPYEVYSDLYQHRLLPENLGAIKLMKDGSGTEPKQFLENAKKLSVIRDSWASFYVNITEISQPEGQKKFKQTVELLRNQGYEFISLDQLGLIGK